MNTHTFGNHSVTCPICQRTGSLKLIKICNGLFTCPSCQERLVVTWSGHYVRDPHNNCKQAEIAQLLRRQSRPFARIIRDFGFIKHPPIIVAIASAIVLGISVIALENSKSSDKQLPETSEQITKHISP